MAKFLPKEAPGATYEIARNATTTFVAEPNSFLHNVATRMAVEPVDDAGRIPSLLSPAYSFYIDLFPQLFAGGAALRPERQHAQKRARQAFRGIIALLALRNLLGLKIELRSFDQEDQAKGVRVGEYRQVFTDGYKGAPGFDNANAAGPWLRFSYLVLRSRALSPDGENRDVVEPLCGLSPYSLFYPAATRMAGCNNVFWYNPESGLWFDPTEDPPTWPSGGTRVARSVVEAIRGCLDGWLTRVLADGPEAVWNGFGMGAERAGALRAELESWLRELRSPKLPRSAAPAGLRVQTESLSLGVPGVGGHAVIPLLEQRAAWDAGAGSELHRIVTELPRVAGRILLSDQILHERTVRVCGCLMGDNAFAGALNNLPAEGEGFVLTHGVQTFYIPEPYVIVDKLFLDKIHLLADDSISENFFAMTTGGAEEKHWLFPFKPELLRYVDLKKLCSKGGGSVVKCTRSGGAGNDLIEVSVEVGDWRFIKTYAQDRRNNDMAGNALDLRIWPNYRFVASPRIPAVAADRVHYFRVRQRQEWGLVPAVIGRRSDGGEEVASFTAQPWDEGWPEQLNASAYRMGRCFAFPSTDAARLPGGQQVGGEWDPIGVSFDGRGLVLFELAQPRFGAGAQAPHWKIGIDFGTSNSCVARDINAPGVASDLNMVVFEMQTAALHQRPYYHESGSAEKAASVLDFPYRYTDENWLVNEPYFPSQLVTRLQLGQPPPYDSKFGMSGGLVFPRNLIDNQDIVMLLRDYPPARAPEDRPFSLIPRPKWENRMYRKTFLWHLYKMVVHHAGRHGAIITTAAFSFPRAFDQTMQQGYEDDLRQIFGAHGEIAQDAMDFMTESDAVQRWWLSMNHPDQHPVFFDVGGGTTDVLGLFQNRSIQASYELAAQYVNQYFTASPRLGSLLLQAIYDVVPLQQAGTPDGVQQRKRRKLLDELLAGLVPGRRTQEGYSEQAFFFMLGMLRENHYPSVVNKLHALQGDRQHSADRQAVMGFFLTLTLLYAGMVYQAGRLLRQNEIVSQVVGMRFIGNGSRFYRFLGNRANDFAKVLRGVFAAAYGATPEVTHDLTPEGKTYVAKGLIARLADVPHRAEVTGDIESSEYLMKLANAGDAEAPAATADNPYPDLRALLEALQRQLPGGQLNGAAVIPYCDANLAKQLTDLFPFMSVAVHGREVEHAEKLKKASHLADTLAQDNEGAAALVRQSAHAVEPIFITRLKCLLDQIRDKYAHSR